MYSKSTTIFNYWDGRDIGIVAPVNNSNYNISKITVTDGTRKSNTSANVWYSSDTIEWNKTLNAADKEWHDETEVWNKSSGTTPMVNGKNSNITRSANNTAKLVLIYLEPIEKETNLNVQYIDLNANNNVFHSYQIVMTYNQGYPEPMFTDKLMLNNTLIGDKGPWNGSKKRAMRITCQMMRMLSMPLARNRSSRRTLPQFLESTAFMQVACISMRGRTFPDMAKPCACTTT